MKSKLYYYGYDDAMGGFAYDNPDDTNMDYPDGYHAGMKYAEDVQGKPDGVSDAHFDQHYC